MYLETDQMTQINNPTRDIHISNKIW